MKNTITSSSKISWMFENGTKFSSASFLALYDLSFKEGKSLNEPPQGSVAFIAGKKLGAAPLRSRAKRRLREAARHAGVPWEDCQVVFVARKGVFKRDFTELIKEFERLRAAIDRFKEDATYLGSKANHNGLEAASGARKPLGQRIIKAIVGIPRTLALLCIKVYRHAISPLFPPSCRYVPTCSEYALIAFERFGFWKGLWLSIKRVGRCHPFAEGGFDPVPECVHHS